MNLCKGDDLRLAIAATILEKGERLTKSFLDGSRRWVFKDTCEAVSFIHKSRKTVSSSTGSGMPLSWRSNLYASSLHLIAANAAASALGFLFWAAAARLYQPQEVGLAAAALSAVGLLAMFSMLGLDHAMIRFLPHAADPQRIINSSLTIGSIAALVLSLVFVAGLGAWSPPLLPLRGSPLFMLGFVGATVLTTVMSLVSAILLARKRVHFVCAQALVFGGVKLVCAVILAVIAHAVGLIGSWAVGLVAASACGVMLFLPLAEDGKYVPRVLINQDVVKKMARFALANYLSTVLWFAPTFLLPLLVVSMAGPKANAYFFVASSASGLLAMIPTAFSLSLFAHGSHNDTQVVRRAVESARGILWLLVPAIGAVFLAGDKVLLVFGRSYSQQGTVLLWLLALSTLPMTANFLFFSIRKVQERMGVVVASTTWILVVTLGLSAVLLPRMGLVGTGVASFVAHSSAALAVSALYLFRRCWL